MKKITALILSLTISAIASAKGFTITWEDNSERETAYVVERSTDGENFEEIGVVPANSESFNDETPKEGVEYSFRVKAVNEVAESAYSPVAKGVLPLNAPSGTKVIISISQ